jgi:hypothetical protein
VEGVLEFLPHAANLTRNVVLRSQSATGTRGHTLFTHRADVDIRYATFGGLGRTTNQGFDDTTSDAAGNVTHVGTNQRGRYPVHFHHLIGPATAPLKPYQYTFVGNVVTCPLDPMPFIWGVTVHNSHHGLIQDNVIHNWAGAGLALEAGSESYNVVAHNFVARVTGSGHRDNGGLDGNGYWMHGPNNYLRDNVATAVRGNGPYAYSFNFAFTYTGVQDVPAFQGADPSVAGEAVAVDMNAMPLREVARNEAYGAIANGLTYWWVNTFGTIPRNGGPSTIKDFRVWHHYQYGVFAYESNHLTIDGMVARGSQHVYTIGNGAIGVYLADYFARDWRLTNADFQGLAIAVDVSTHSGGGTQTIDNSYFRNVLNVYARTLWTSASRADLIPDRKVVIRNVLFDPIPGLSHTAVQLDYLPHHSNLIARDEVFVYDYNRVPGDNFQVYYREQVADFILLESSLNPDGTPALLGSPEVGLTNLQNWNKYGIALAGAVAPANALTRPEISGLVRPF